VLCGENWSEARIFLQEMKAMTKDPVCGMNVDENNSQYQSEHKGKQYSFCSEQCKNKFDQHPEQYARSAA
jgi:YHS domain-containing protein